MRSLASLLLMLSLAACGSSSAGDEGSSGVSGSTVVDVGCPVQPADSDCPVRPIEASVQAMAAGSADVVAETTSDRQGAFVLDLEPGRYVVVGKAEESLPMPQTVRASVTVKAGAYAEVRIAFDSGVRTPGPASSP